MAQLTFEWTAGGLPSARTGRDRWTTLWTSAKGSEHRSLFAATETLLPTSSSKEVTDLLRCWSAGDPQARAELMPLVYGTLRSLAAGYLRREHSGHSVQATALIHEAYLRLVDQTNVSWQNRAHFYGIAAQSMRRVLLDHARKRATARRRGMDVRVTLSDLENEGEPRGLDLIALDKALTQLAAMDPRQGRIVELRYFGGLSVEECANVLGISQATVKRDWGLARAWLHRELST
jgi:RNA polymerase sigma factor (TIGR02999 family)